MRGGRTDGRVKRRVLHIGHAAVRAMPPLRGELLRSMMMGQQGGSLRCAPSMEQLPILRKNAFMQSADLINVPGLLLNQRCRAY